MKTAVVTYIYPQGVQFLPDFLAALQQQGDQDFELIVFNDGVQQAHSLFEDEGRKVTIHDVTGTPVAIRFQSIPVLAATNVEQLIFQDIDDGMSANRVACCKQWLQEYLVVCNDLRLWHAGAAIAAEGSWQSRLQDGFVFNHSFLLNQNLVGLGNTAIRRSLLEFPVQYHPDPLAADWFIFYQLLFQSKASVVFTSACYTLYRQHEQNSAGLKVADQARLQQVLQVCNKQHSALKELGYVLPESRTNMLQQAATAITRNHYFYNSPIGFQNLFWWEELNYLYEKN